MIRHEAHSIKRPLIALAICLAGLFATENFARANPYVAKAGEPVVKVRIGTCAITGGFIHLYAALDNRLFDKYGIQAEHSSSVAAPWHWQAWCRMRLIFFTAMPTRTSCALARERTQSWSLHLIGLPYVVLARKDIKRPADLRGKSIGVTRPGDFPYRLAKEFLKKHNLSEKEVTLATVGGTPTERYTALLQDIFQATLIQPPLDARGKKDGFNVIYNLNELGLPFIYSSLFASGRTWKERPGVVQKVVAALAESVYFVEKNPELAMASVGKTLRMKDPDTLRSAYEAYAKNLINRRMIVPAKMVVDTLDLAREDGASIRKKPNEIFDNTFVEHLDKAVS